MDEHGDGKMTRGFAAAGATHPIRNDHRIAVLVEARGYHPIREARQERLLMPAQPQDQIVVLVDQT